MAVEPLPLRERVVVPPRRDLDPEDFEPPEVAVLPDDDRLPARLPDDLRAVDDLRVALVFRAPPVLPDLRAAAVPDDLRAPPERVPLADFAVVPDFRAPPVLLRAVDDRLAPLVAPAPERLLVDFLVVVPLAAVLRPAERFAVVPLAVERLVVERLAVEPFAVVRLPVVRLPVARLVAVPPLLAERVLLALAPRFAVPRLAVVERDPVLPDDVLLRDVPEDLRDAFVRVAIIRS